MSDVYAKAGWVDATTASVAMAGAIVGQLAMGLVGDLIGVNRALRLTLVLTAAGALLSAVLPWGDATSAWLIGWWLGSILLRLPVASYYFLLLLASPARVETL